MTFYLGIDIGGTEIKAGVVCEDGKIHDEIKRPTGKTKEEVLKTLGDILRWGEEKNCKGVGISTAGSVDTEKGNITEIGGNLPDWANTPLKEELALYSTLPIVVGNDGNLALLAEMAMGAGVGGKNVIMLTLGTGLGSGFYFEKLGLYTGSHWKGAEMGHVTLYPKGRICVCGRCGCAEKYVSGTALEINYYEETHRKKRGREIMETVNQDPFAKKALDRWIYDMGVMVHNIKSTFDPDLVILGGGVIESKEIWWDAMCKNVLELNGGVEEMEIKPAKFSNQAGILGAAILAKEVANHDTN